MLLVSPDKTQALINNMTLIVQDAFNGLERLGIVVYNDDNPNIGRIGSWQYYIGEGFYYNDEHFSNQQGDYIDFYFIGTSIKYIAATSWNLGKCDVYIDGNIEASGLDAYSDSLHTQEILFCKDGMPFGEHRIQIIVTGERNPDATDCYVTLDAFEIS